MSVGIKELRPGGAVASLLGLVDRKTEAKTKADKPYLRLTIRDKDDTIDCVLWDYAPESYADLSEGDVVEVAGTVGAHNGTAQLVLNKLTPSALPISDFARSTKFDVEAMWHDLVAVVDRMTEPLTKWITEELLIKHAFMSDAFKKAPAARGVHNAWYGGLLEHVHSICLLAQTVVPHYQRRYCEKISMDKVMFGLIMHDAGKIIEYDYTRPSFNHTPIGLLTNHMVVGSDWTYEAANKWWAANKSAGLMTVERFKLERALLCHVLVAHHGRVDWGSPVKPATLEAILVHHLDNLDAKMLHALDYVNGKPGQVASFSERSYVEGTSFYQYT